MKRMIHTAIGPWLKRLIVWALLLSFAAIPAVAEITQADLVLNPDPLEYEGGNIVLSKQAERIGPDEWRVNVQAVITGSTVKPPEIEVVFVLDKSSSMNSCANEASHLQKSVHKYDTCTDHVHTSSCFEICTPAALPEHYYNNGRYHYGNTSCISNDGRYFTLVCPNTHVHTAACCSCGTDACLKHADNVTCYYLDGSVWQPYTSRYAYAVDAVTSLSNGVTAKSIKFVLFSGTYYGTDVVQTVETLEELAAITPSGSTYLIQGVDVGCGMFSTEAATRKIMVIVTDGVATDKKYTSSTFETFTDNGGVVFTVGFNNIDVNLEGMVANGGAYYYASNPGELTSAFNDIGDKLTAMVEDPMGSAVGFDKDKILITEGTDNPIDGELSNAGNTIYWTPTEEGNTLTGTIAYHYTVKLNDDANTNEGMHGTTVEDPVPLNNPTWFHYGTTEEMKKVLFPIPYAAYGVSSLQTTWQTRDGTRIFETTEVEKIKGCDYEFFTPAFTQDYTNTSPIIDGDTTYRYVGTEVYINGVKQEGGLELINPAQPNAYTVYHLYEEIKPGSLTVSKEVGGNMGSRNREFPFQLTMPEMANRTINISTDGGATFTSYTLNGEGKYTFTLKHGDSVVFYPAKGSCTVEETDTGGYTVRYSANGAAPVTAAAYTGTVAAESATMLTFTNTLNAEVPTGIVTSTGAALAGLMLSTALTAISLAGRRRRDAQ